MLDRPTRSGVAVCIVVSLVAVAVGVYAPATGVLVLALAHALVLTHFLPSGLSQGLGHAVRMPGA